MKKWTKCLAVLSLLLTVLSPFNVWAKDSGEMKLEKIEDTNKVTVTLTLPEGANENITSLRFQLYVYTEYGSMSKPTFEFAGHSSVMSYECTALDSNEGYVVDIILSGTENEPIFDKNGTAKIGTLEVMPSENGLYASVGMIRQENEDSGVSTASVKELFQAGVDEEASETETVDTAGEDNLPVVEYVNSASYSVMTSKITNSNKVYVGVEPTPTPTATPIPTVTPTAEPAPSETPEPTPSETPEPTPSETPEPTPSETPEQQPTITPGPVVSSDGIEAEPVLGTRKVNLSWPEVSDADGYVVYMKNEETGKFKRIKTIYNTEQTSLSKLLDFGGTHTFKICTFTKVPGAPSIYENLGDEITVKLYGYNKYEQPAATASTKTGSKQINLQWDKVEDADGYMIYKYNTSTKKYELLDKVAGDDTTSYSFTNGLENGVTYAFRVRSYALKEDGETQVNGKISATFKTTTPPAKAKKPAAVSKVKAQAQISWTKVANAKGYRVYRSTSRNGKYTSVGTITDAKTLQFTDSKKLKSGKTYFYKIRAYSLNPDGSKSFGAISAAKAVKVK